MPKRILRRGHPIGTVKQRLQAATGSLKAIKAQVQTMRATFDTRDENLDLQALQQDVVGQIEALEEQQPLRGLKDLHNQVLTEAKQLRDDIATL